MVLFNTLLPIFLITCCPIFLWILAKPPFKVLQPGLRFKITSVLVLLFWGLVALTHRILFWYWISGLLLIVAFLIFSFMVWSVLCWGYSIRMLLVLDEQLNPVGFLQWQKLYSGPNGTRQLALNRTLALLQLNLIKVNGYQFTISRKGIYLAKVAQLFRLLFGVAA